MRTRSQRVATGFAAVVMAASLTTSLPLTGPAFADPSTVGAEVLTDEAVVAAEHNAEQVVEGLEDMYTAAFLEAPEAAAESAEDVADELDVTTQGEAAIEDIATTIIESAELAADAPTGALVIDEVTVEQVSEPEVSETADGKVSAIVDLEITRHIAEHDVDWVEVIPHEVVTDAITGEITSVVPHTTEYQIENAEPEKVTPRLMNFPDEPAQVAPAGLSSANRDKVAAYATKYAKKYNKAYKAYSLDCTNFVSQAMLAGGWKEKSHPWIDYKSDKAWWYGGIPTNSWSWSGAENFYRMARTLGRTKHTPYVTDLRKGDILQYKSKGSSTMTHSMIVTKKSKGELFLTYHSSDTLNRPFSQMANMKVAWFTHKV